MGLLDWLERKVDPLAAAKRRPEVRRALLAMETEATQKQANNLRAVGREADAKRIVKEHLDKMFAEWKKEPDDPFHLVRLSYAAIQLNEMEAGRRFLEAVVEVSKEKPLFDLTPVYFELGRSYHFPPRDSEKELCYYQMAIEAKCPAGAKYKASQEMKAKMHSFAAGAANALMRFDVRDHHDSECQRLVPNVDLNDFEAKFKFIQETQR